MRKKTAIWMALIVALGSAATVAAKDWDGEGYLAGPPGMERFHGERLERLASFLELSEQQIEEWRALHEGRYESGRAQRDEMRALHERIRELAEADSPDPAAVGELVIEAHRKMAAARAAREAIHAQVLAILTPEQQERFEALRGLHGDREGRGRHGFRRHMRSHGSPELD